MRNNLENVLTNKSEENSSTPTPKLRTKYLDPLLDDNSGLTHVDKPTDIEFENLSNSTSSINSASNSSKWKRRSIKHTNIESDDNETGKNESK